MFLIHLIYGFVLVIILGSWMPSSGTNQREESNTQQTPGQSVPPPPSGTTDSSPSVRGPSETPRNPVALVIPVVARYQQVSTGERNSTGLNGVHQPVAESSRQPQSASTPGNMPSAMLLIYLLKCRLEETVFCVVVCLI